MVVVVVGAHGTAAHTERVWMVLEVKLCAAEGGEMPSSSSQFSCRLLLFCSASVTGGRREGGDGWV